MNALNNFAVKGWEPLQKYSSPLRCFRQNVYVLNPDLLIFFFLFLQENLHFCYVAQQMNL